MKLIIEDVQVAIKGVTKYDNQCISEQLLAVVAGNYAVSNHIILLRLQSLYEEYDQPVIGEIKNLYYTEKTGKAQLRGDLIFDTEKLDIQSILHSLAHGCVYLSPGFMNVTSLNYCLTSLHEVTLSKAEDTNFEGIEPLDISCLDGLINALYKEEPATEAPESAIRFSKKYDEADSGFIGTIDLRGVPQKAPNEYAIQNENKNVFIHIKTKRNIGDVALFRLSELNAVKRTGCRGIACQVCVANVNIYPNITFNQFVKFINDVLRNEKNTKATGYRTYTLNIDDKKYYRGRK
ncbi:hypothetical protein MXG19_003741 [Salmonella enterica]|nr:hypothetical protein [Salmonella enterica]EJB8933643.1 hypothetical protein [Salmonella enterica]EJC0216718.1 hypothetical protein [Salmonella enterica]EJC0222296.1 hypothetical protein [Salmonella enterica]EJC0230643.1 hypothetical protein [Salmonella enterica]